MRSTVTRLLQREHWLPHRPGERAGVRTSTAWAQTRGLGLEVREGGLEATVDMWSGCRGKDSSEKRVSEWIPGLCLVTGSVVELFTMSRDRGGRNNIFFAYKITVKGISAFLIVI